MEWQFLPTHLHIVWTSDMIYRCISQIVDMYLKGDLLNQEAARDYWCLCFRGLLKGQHTLSTSVIHKYSHLLKLNLYLDWERSTLKFFDNDTFKSQSLSTQ